MSEIDDLLAEADLAVMEAEQDAVSANERLETARADRDAIRRIVGRRSKNPLPPSIPSPNVAEEWRSLTRADAIIRILRETGQAMSPAEIAEALIGVGREGEKYSMISNTMTKLKKRGQVQHGSHGKWTTSEPEEERFD